MTYTAADFAPFALCAADPKTCPLCKGVLSLRAREATRRMLWGLAPFGEERLNG